MNLKNIERKWLSNFQVSPLVKNGIYLPEVAYQLFYGFEEGNIYKKEFKLGFKDFKDEFDFSNASNNLTDILKYLSFIGIIIQENNLKESLKSGKCTYDSLLKKTFYLLKHLAFYDSSLDIRNPYYDNLGDLYFFMRIEASSTDNNSQLSLFEEVPLPDFYNKYIELPENYENDKVAIELFEEIENTNNSYFITGKAGTGKSTFIHYFTKNTSKDTLIFAFTGIAAINVGGQTLHSFFGFPFKPLLPKDSEIRKFNVNFQKFKIIQQAKTIIIDEVSMLRSDILEGLDFSLRINGGSQDKPFGGKQMIFVGDAFQLPPIVDRNSLELEIFSKIYESEYFFDSPSFQILKPKLFEFKNVHRQSDGKFIMHLNKFRNYEIRNEDIEYFNERFYPSFIPNMNDFVMMLTSTNYVANTENQRRINQLPYTSHWFKAKIDGDFSEDKYPTLEILELKRSAQVMFVKNDSNENGRRWVNGTIGKVNFIKNDFIEVELANGETYEVYKELWENRKFQWDNNKKEITSKIIGTFEQFPLKLAWAITIHKSQGLSFDKVNIDLGRGAFVNGQLYTALSRCRTIEGLTLKKKINRNDIIADNRLIEFSKCVEKGEIISERTFTFSKKEIEKILDKLKLDLNHKNIDDESTSTKLIKYRLNSELDFGKFRGEKLEKILKENPKYLLELLDIENIVISPSTLEIIQDKFIEYDIPSDKIEQMKLKNDRYLEQNK